ncbi:hypothetical protein V8E51_017567 [Hyaloscypha variabilis]
MDLDPNAFIRCFRLPKFGTSLSDSEFDAHGEPVRHRRSRGKSRAGCDKCKERRVKCDEKRPSCWNCTKLKLHCGFLKDANVAVVTNLQSESAPVSFHLSDHLFRQFGQQESASTPFSFNPSSKLFSQFGQAQDNVNALTAPVSNGIYPPLNMSHMQLFHHFATVTSGTLVFGRHLWEEKVLPSAFKHEYLMHALLFMAASHLRHLQPHNSCHRMAELEHFSQVIPAFSAALLGPITEDNIYALPACSLLILQYAWACPELNNRDVNDAVDFGFGSLIGLYSGMRSLSLSLLTIRDQYLHSIMFHRPIFAIKRYSEGTSVVAELEEFFTHCCKCPEWCGTGDQNFDTRMEAARRLLPILAALKLGERELEKSDVMQDIPRYLFVLPLVSSEQYGHLLRNNDEASLVILLYYFALVRRLLSGKYWWMRERSAHLCEWLLTRLGDKCERCVGWAREISAGQPIS